MLVLAMLVVCRKVLLQSFSEMERRHVDNDMKRTLNLVEFESGNLDNIARDYATWDDTWKFMVDRNDDYLDSNYGDLALQNLNLRLVMLVNEHRAVTLLKSLRIAPGGSEATKDVDELLRAASTLDERTVATGKKGILLFSDGPVLVALHPIRTSTGSGPTRGVLIMARNLDYHFLARISSVVQVPLVLKPNYEQREPLWREASTQLKAPGSSFVRALDEDRLVEFSVLNDFYGESKLLLRIMHPREIWHQGKKATQILMAFIVVMGVIFGILNVWLIHRYVVSRIEKLIHFTTNFKTDQGLGQRILIAGNDEIAQLGEQMNQMLHQLQLSHEELVTASARLQFEATHDALTGAWNRAAALEMLDRELDRCSREHNEVAVIMLDVDHFKSINDRYGHSAGDIVLKCITSVIARNLRSFDVLARYGGEEFLVIAPACSLAGARGLTHRILHRLQAATIPVADTSIHVSASAGITVGSSPLKSEDLIALADRAMYRAKGNGRNRAHCEEPDRDSPVRGAIYAMPGRLV